MVNRFAVLDEYTGDGERAIFCATTSILVTRKVIRSSEKFLVLVLILRYNSHAYSFFKKFLKKVATRNWRGKTWEKYLVYLPGIKSRMTYHNVTIDRDR